MPCCAPKYALGLYLHKFLNDLWLWDATICTTVCTWKNEEKTNVKTTVSPSTASCVKLHLDKYA